MTRFVTKEKTKKAGWPPATVVFSGAQKDRTVHLSVLEYDANTFHERTLGTVEEAVAYRDTPSISWINVDGIHDPALIEQLGQHFGIHPLVLEDIVTRGQRAKLEDYDDYLYIVLKMLYFDQGTLNLRGEQVSLVVGKNFVISFLEDPGDLFDLVRDRIRTRKGRLCRMQADFLAYTLLDVVIDHYFIVLDTFGELTEALEEEIIKGPTNQTATRLNMLRRELVFARKAMWPVREVMSGFSRVESGLIDPETRPFLRDAYDHAVQVIDVLESLHDVLGGTMDLLLSFQSNRMNEVMKFLTIIGTIFIPLTFIVGIYGMNFDVMPELRWPYGYPLILLVMAAIGLGMVAYFRHKQWI
jgi:magnesium transporter